MGMFAASIIGFALGLAIGALIFGKTDKPIGDIVVENSDPEDGPYLFLELDTPIHQFVNSKQVTCNVKMKSYISQK